MSAEVKSLFFAIICLNIVSLVVFISVAKNRIWVDLSSFDHMENTSTRSRSRSITDKSLLSIRGKSSRSNGFAYAINTKSVIKKKHLKIQEGKQQEIGYPFSQFEKEVPKIQASAQTSKNTHKCNGTEDKLNIKGDDTFWNSEKEPHLYIRSAYLDYRFEKPVVQFLTIMGHNLSESIICHFAYYRPCKEISVNVPSSLTDLFKNDRTKCFYLQVIVKCPFSTDDPPDYIAVSTNSTGPTVWLKPKVIRSLKEEENNRSNVGLCVKNLVNYREDFIPDMVTFLEMHRILGVDQVMVYDLLNSSSVYKNLLQHYENQGFVRLVPWKHGLAGRSSQDMRDQKQYKMIRSINGTRLHQCVALYTQRLALQDCVMSNMERFKYIIVVDVDEFIIPSSGYSYVDMIRELKKHFHKAKLKVPVHSYVFLEKHYCPDMDNGTGIRFGMTKRLNGTTLNHPKIMSFPKYVDQISEHRVIKPITGKQNVVPPSIGTVHHYRQHKSFCQEFSDKKAPPYLRVSFKPDVVTDTTAIKYFSELSTQLAMFLQDFAKNLRQDVVDKIKTGIQYLKKKR